MAKTTKGEQTRALILKTAVDLFHQRGYEETTMRAVAAEAGVSLGNAYYYFKSKEHLIQAFYDRTHKEHLAVCAEILAEERDFRKRLGRVLRVRIDTLLPYHRFAGVLFRTAADPRSPLNPFSAESRPVRRESTELAERTVELLARLVSVASLAPMRPLVRSGLALLKDLRDEGDDEG